MISFDVTFMTIPPSRRESRQPSTTLLWLHTVTYLTLPQQNRSMSKQPTTECW
jgi:hypothetical protein